MAECQHKFEPRYDVEPPTSADFPPWNVEKMLEVIAALTRRVYRGDVCVSCGQVANKPEAP